MEKIKKMNPGFGDDKVCPICDKKFFVVWAPEYVYKRTGIVPKEIRRKLHSGRTATYYFCSYSCTKKFDDLCLKDQKRKRAIPNK